MKEEDERIIDENGRGGRKANHVKIGFFFFKTWGVNGHFCCSEI